jgi:hypothetical protein
MQWLPPGARPGGPDKYVRLAAPGDYYNIEIYYLPLLTHLVPYDRIGPMILLLLQTLLRPQR